ncbi:voltage-dependent calcium channel gamma-6 subunit isoform X3 [Mesoplodon densirostris]|uniref:voltage-dependent calcium channel gamma-6 subunit isoform X3 n=1 Tax=Mesoplodon densirostris TaxID=48708 RepID=UPI0028DCC00B|nr:voltage-dependent calcium channel gamma-6 subunit isoform X3 [Mesoplodon densirostris]
MMWSNFFMHEEGRRRARGARQAGMAPEHEGKIKLALLLTSVGATLAVLAVGTEFWVELNTYRDNGSAVCDAAHLGLWKMCTKRLWQVDVPAGRDTCGPAELPGGLLLLVSLEVFRHSVQALLQRVSPEPPPSPALTYEYSWSLGCGLGAGLVLILGSGFFLLLTLPPWPWGSLCPKWGHRAT